MLFAEGVNLSFADSGGTSFAVLDTVRFKPEPGKITTISGPSGSGKSTLLYVLAGLLPPGSGNVSFNGTNLYAMTERRRDTWRRTNIGFIFQDFHLIEELSPLANATLQDLKRTSAALRSVTERIETQGAGSLVGGSKLPDYKP